MSKISKTVLPCLGDSVAGWSSRMSQSRAHTEIFCGSLAGHCPNHEKYLEYFSKFGFLMFLTTQSGDLFARGLRDFLGLPRDSLMDRTSSHEKHLDKFFKNFISSVSQLVLATCFNHENCVFCILRVIFKVVFKNFSFFPHASLSLIIPSSLALYFLLDPFVYSCQKGRKHTLE